MHCMPGWHKSRICETLAIARYRGKHIVVNHVVVNTLNPGYSRNMNERNAEICRKYFGEMSEKFRKYVVGKRLKATKEM